SRGSDLPDALRIELERIQRNASRLFVLVNDILDFTKMEAGKAQVNWESLDVGEVVRQIVSDASTAAEQKGLKLRFLCEAPVGRVPLDRGKFEKILLNLLGNALKFTPFGGSIEVRLQALGGEFELSVSDSGPGIAPEQQSLLFLRFQQLDSSSTR